MTIIEHNVAEHYGDADLLARIIAGLAACDIDPEQLQPDDLAPVEEFHIGGRKATAYAVARMALGEGQHVLDVGCGIGGTARYVASHTGCKVTGVDLTPEYISVANKLTKQTGLDGKVNFEVASALAMPFEDRSFDAAITIHVAMNISERAALYREIARVMKPTALLGIFDVMRKSDEGLSFPVPWAQSESTSYLTSADEMCSLLEEAGFAVQEIEDRTDFAVEFFKESMAALASGSRPLGIHLVMGMDAPEKMKNVLKNIETGRIAPVQMIAMRSEN